MPSLSRFPCAADILSQDAPVLSSAGRRPADRPPFRRPASRSPRPREDYEGGADSNNAETFGAPWAELLIRQRILNRGMCEMNAVGA